MKSDKNKKAANNRVHTYQLKIETEEYALLLALREAEEQLRYINQNCSHETEPGVEAEKEALATKSNFYRHRLKTVRESLGRIRAGCFGVCASCGDEIGEKRLSAIPTALYCLECQEAYERDRSSLRSTGVDYSRPELNIPGY